MQCLSDQKSFGINELFLSELDIARVCGAFGTIYRRPEEKIIKVIITVLIVSFFQRILSMEFTTSMDMRAMAVSISVICIGMYFLGRHLL
ncbi:MAG: hypothetical protein RQ758_07900 [Methanomicrobiaceae archaeon]|nr:hypothetical protein [Methanomicrobiaceae archaeon]